MEVDRIAPIAASPLDACRGRGTYISIRIRTTIVRNGKSQTKKIKRETRLTKT